MPSTTAVMRHPNKISPKVISGRHRSAFPRGAKRNSESKHAAENTIIMATEAPRRDDVCIDRLLTAL